MSINKQPIKTINNQEVRRSRQLVLDEIKNTGPEELLIPSTGLKAPVAVSDIKRVYQKPVLGLAKRLFFRKKPAGSKMHDVLPPSRPQPAPADPETAATAPVAETPAPVAVKLDEKTKKLWQSEIKAALSEVGDAPVATSRGTIVSDIKRSTPANVDLKPEKQAAPATKPRVRYESKATIAVPKPKYSVSQIAQEKKQVLEMLDTDRNQAPSPVQVIKQTAVDKQPEASVRPTKPKIRPDRAKDTLVLKEENKEAARPDSVVVEAVRPTQGSGHGRWLKLFKMVFWPNPDPNREEHRGRSTKEFRDIKRLEHNFVEKITEDKGGTAVKETPKTAAALAAATPPADGLRPAVALPGKDRSLSGPDEDKTDNKPPVSSRNRFISHVNPFGNAVLAEKIALKEKEATTGSAEKEKDRQENDRSEEISAKQRSERQEAQIKQEKEIKHNSQMQRRLRRVEKRARRRERFSSFVLAAKRKSVIWRAELSRTARQVFSLAILLLVISAFMYLIIAFGILRLDLDQPWVRQIAEILPVPALLGSDGAVAFFVYQDIKQGFMANGENADDAHHKALQKIIENIVINTLSEKYGLGQSVSEISGENERDELLKRLNTSVQYDLEINFAAWSRISRIRDLVRSGQDFESTASRYGDDSGRTTVARDNIEGYEYFEAISALAVTEISPIVIVPEGYYIFKSVRQDARNYYLDYVHIKTISIEEHLRREVMGYRAWVLVKN